MASSPYSATEQISRSQSQLDDFLRRKKYAALYPAKSGAESKSDWELVDKETVQDDQERNEWILVGKTETEKHAQKQGKAIAHDKVTDQDMAAEQDKSAKDKHEQNK